MTRPGIEPRSPGPLANTLTAGPMSRLLSSSDRLFHCITTLQCGQTCWSFEAGIETRPTLRSTQYQTARPTSVPRQLGNYQVLSSSSSSNSSSVRLFIYIYIYIYIYMVQSVALGVMQSPIVRICPMIPHCVKPRVTNSIM